MRRIEQKNRGGLSKQAVWPLVAALSAVPVPAQGNHVPARTPSSVMTVSVSPVAAASGAAEGSLVREIDDQQCGTHWLLLRDDRNPGGPGRLVLVQSAQAGSGGRPTPGPAAEPPAAPQKPVIHAGDRLVIEQETPQISARLEAVALAPAVAGRLFRARLRIGGKIVEAVALAPGRAALEPEVSR